MGRALPRVSGGGAAGGHLLGPWGPVWRCVATGPGAMVALARWPLALSESSSSGPQDAATSAGHLVSATFPSPHSRPPAPPAASLSRPPGRSRQPALQSHRRPRCSDPFPDSSAVATGLVGLCKLKSV